MLYVFLQYGDWEKVNLGIRQDVEIYVLSEIVFFVFLKSVLYLFKIVDNRLAHYR